VCGTDEAGEEAVLLEYSAENRITRISGPGNQQVRIGYDKQGTLPVALSGPAGQATFTYDDSGRPLTETFADSTVLSFTWAGSELEKVDWSRPGASAEERYGPSGVLSTRFSDGRTATYGYTPQGLPSLVRDSRGDTRFEYDANRDLIGIRRPGGVTERVEHTRQGEIDVFSGRPSIRGPEIQFPRSHVPLAAPADI
jgi:YD repeat-containing protein